MIPQVIMVTTTKMPKADLDSSLLANELLKIGVTSQIIPWDDKNIDWTKVPLVLLRTPWDYFYRPEEFFNWLNKVNQVSKLINPLELVEWNMHKSYLLDLQLKGIPIVPTILVNKDEYQKAELIFNDLKFDEIVIKPAISGGAVGALKAKKSAPELFAHLNELLKTHDVLIQPFIPEIIITGEVSLIYFNGEFSHGIHKKGAENEYRVQEEYGGSVYDYNPELSELKLAEEILSKLPIMPTYARIDLVNYKNQSRLMELEIIEPELFLRKSLSGTTKFAKIIKDFVIVS